MSRSQYITYCVGHQLDLEQQAITGALGVVRDVLADNFNGADPAAVARASGLVGGTQLLPASE